MFRRLWQRRPDRSAERSMGRCRTKVFNGRPRLRLVLETLEDRTMFSFGAATSYSVFINPSGVAVGDFNGDGAPDLVVATQGATAGHSGANVLLGNGDGSFQDATLYSTALGSHAVAVGDFTGKGVLDLVLAYNDYGGAAGVLLGNGDGSFRKVVYYAVGHYATAVAVGDFNGDGNLDLAVTNKGDDTVSVLLGNGDGTFQTPVNYAVGSSPSAVAVGDFNGDGTLDLAVANNNAGTVSVLLGNGDGTFQAPVDYVTGSGPSAVAVGDFNGDGTTDLAVTNDNSNTVSVLLGNGDGSFQSAVNYAVGSYPDAVAASDFNGDGTPDLAVANLHSNNVSVLLGNGDGSLQTALNYDAGGEPVSVAVGDFNGDGFPDLATANQDNTATVLLNNADWGTGPTASSSERGPAALPAPAHHPLSPDPRSADRIMADPQVLDHLIATTPDRPSSPVPERSAALDPSQLASPQATAPATSPALVRHARTPVVEGLAYPGLDDREAEFHYFLTLGTMEPPGQGRAWPA